ncbi:MAG: S8 family serine peptidase, partial [Deltaproteobacteria bacterium]|nr:S8 family serine peptidase [Deltaproteobacteria bacterium]
IIVASAGNEGSDGMGYPGGMEEVISCGAAGWTTMFYYDWYGDAPEQFNKKDFLGNNWQVYLEYFSSRPNKDLWQKHQDLDVTAPGAWVLGPYRPEFSDQLGYWYVSGTSMASPHVAATAALVMADHPYTNQFEMEWLLEKAAAGNPLPASDAWVCYDYPCPYIYPVSWDGGDYGSGFLQADAALKVAAGH